MEQTRIVEARGLLAVGLALEAARAAIQTAFDNLEPIQGADLDPAIAHNVYRNAQVIEVAARNLAARALLARIEAEDVAQARDRDNLSTIGEAQKNPAFSALLELAVRTTQDNMEKEAWGRAGGDRNAPPARSIPLQADHYAPRQRWEDRA